MADPPPILRQMPADILCSLGWIQGTLHLPAHQSLDEYLALSGPSIKLTRAHIPREPEPQQFVALRRDSISLVVPVMGGPVMTSAAYGPTKQREIACLLPDRILRGSVQMPAALRLSDFLRLEGPSSPSAMACSPPTALPSTPRRRGPSSLPWSTEITWWAYRSMTGDRPRALGYSASRVTNSCTPTPSAAAMIKVAAGPHGSGLGHAQV
jgi:hypothetical protein